MRNEVTVSTLTLTALQAEELLRLADGDGPVVVTVVARENHVWRLRQGEDGFFLKTHTKDWYQGGVDQLGACMRLGIVMWGSFTWMSALIAGS